MSNKPWRYEEHFRQLPMSSDYDGHYEVTNGDISLCTIDDPEDISDTQHTLDRVVAALNDSGCKFYVNTAAELNLHNENMLLRMALEEIAESNCDYESVNFAKAIHSPECRACRAKQMLESIKSKSQTNDTTGTNKG